MVVTLPCSSTEAALCSSLEPPRWKELRELQLVGRLSLLLCDPLKAWQLHGAALN